MFNRNDMQAQAITTGTKNGRRTLREFSRYPEVPAGWPNRATRRAVKHGHTHRLSNEWRQVLTRQPDLRKHIAAL